MTSYERFEMRLDEQTANKIDIWRNKNNANKSRAEAVRELVEIGFEARDNDKLYEIMRMQVLLNPLHFNCNSYLFAWSSRIHPFLHQNKIHSPFISNSVIKQNEFSMVYEYLAEKFRSQENTNYYDLEFIFGEAEFASQEARLKIYSICRYIYLLDKYFDDNFWQNLVKDTHGKSIIDPFEFETDVQI